MTSFEIILNYFGPVNGKIGEGDIMGNVPREIQKKADDNGYVRIVDGFYRIRFAFPKWMVDNMDRRIHEYAGNVVKARIIMMNSPNAKFRLELFTIVVNTDCDS